MNERNEGTKETMIASAVPHPDSALAEPTPHLDENGACDCMCADCTIDCEFCLGVTDHVPACPVWIKINKHTGP